MNSLFLIILAHIFADFPFQTDKICLEKSRMHWLGYLKHMLIVFITLVILLIPYIRVELIIALFLFSLVHMIVDIIKNAFTIQKRTGPVLFLTDQAVHFSLLYIFWGVMDFPLNHQVQKAANFLLFPKAVEVWNRFFAGVHTEKVLLTLIIYAMVIYGGAVFTKKVLNLPLFDLRYMKDRQVLDEEDLSVSEIKKVGYYLGMLERALIITLTALNSLSAVAFVLTAKSIARFSELNQKDFAEYYLTGTLLSVFLGIMGGVGLRYFLSCI